MNNSLSPQLTEQKSKTHDSCPPCVDNNAFIKKKTTVETASQLNRTIVETGKATAPNTYTHNC